MSSKSPSLRRIQADIRELALDPSDRYHAAPLENDMFEWHFTIRGAEGTDFEGGIYHGRILLPPEYPFKPPHIIMLTPSGRFETNTKICLSFSAFHPELWQPAWGIRLILEALISFLPTPADGAIGAVDWSPAERKKLAQKSIHYECPACGKTANLLPKLKAIAVGKQSRFQKEIEELQRMQMLEHAKREEEENEKLVHVVGAAAEAPAPASEQDSNVPTVMHDTVAAVRDGLAHTETNADEDGKSLPRDGPGSETLSPSLVQEQLRHDRDDNVETVGDNDRSNLKEEQSAAGHQETAPAAEQVVPHINNAYNLTESPSLLDPILQGIICVLSVICFLLLRKIQALVEDIHALEEGIE